MSCAWRDERCRIGLILGTGTNACYLEEIKDIHTIDQVIIINSLQSLPHKYNNCIAVFFYWLENMFYSICNSL